MTKEELVEKLEKVGIKGEWVNQDKYGFSRIYQFNLGDQTIRIEWYCNYSTLIMGNIRFWFDNIRINSSYLEHGEWIEFSFRGEHPIHIRASE